MQGDHLPVPEILAALFVLANWSDAPNLLVNTVLSVRRSPQVPRLGLSTKTTSMSSETNSAKRASILA